MKMLLFAIAIGLAAATGHAQTPLESASTAATGTAPAPVVVRQNAVIYSADGHVVGRVDHVRSVAGVPTTAGVIYSGAFIEIPISTLTASGRRLVTSITTAQLRR